MASPVITIYVRHTPTCKYAGDEFTKRCTCRKHFRWSKDGKQYRKQAGTRSWAEAEDIKADLADQLAGRVTAKRVADAKTLSDALESFLKGKKVKGIDARTYDRYRLEVTRLISFCVARNVFVVEGLDMELMTDYKVTWPERYPSTTTQHQVQLCLRVFLNYCHQVGWLSHVPKMEPVKVNEPPTTPLTDEEYQKVLKAAKTKRTRAIILLMRFTGLAIRDASCLLKSELVMSKLRAHVITARQKTGIHVRVPVPWDVAKEIRAAANKTGDHLFYDGKAQPANFSMRQGQNVSWAFARAGVRADCFMVSHRLRDTFACNLLSKGVPMEEVSRLLGHSSINTTEKHYAQWAKGRQDRVDELVSGTWG